MHNLTLTIKGEELVFETRGGVFSSREIDPGSKLLAESFVATPRTNVVLDLGCGYGVIGIAIAKLYPEIHVLLSDDSLRASEMAKRNVELNGLKSTQVVLSDGFSRIERKFDAIVSNLPLGYGMSWWRS